ncbi:hypothetical protein B0T10DRAFT_102363 [Thelonectria olida]|uniref:C6 transcription factor n=1 Tax=Thelonectria olida TaxID=1576542 RepID=A0A9P8WHT8_9HYPO|nr:hypothetical protein B0T10DRAFT_102363 [Thelonectria olida]
MVSTRASSRAASAIPEPSPPPTESSSSSSPAPASALPLLSPLPSTPRRRTTTPKQNTTSKRKRRSAAVPEPDTPTTDTENDLVKVEEDVKVEADVKDAVKHYLKDINTAKDTPAAAPPTTPLTWSHTPTTLTLLWLAISLPLVIWDTGYILGRPHTFEGGSLHWPLWVPYRLYAKVDYVYSRRAWDSNNGFSGAQSALNAVETIVYFVYLYLFFSHGEVPAVGGKNARRSVSGRNGALAVLVGFSAALMTLSKTLLYFAHEYYSGFDNIGHNSVRDLIMLWIIPNGPWIVIPTYMVYSHGKNILDGLTMGSAPSKLD